MSKIINRQTSPDIVDFAKKTYNVIRETMFENKKKRQDKKSKPNKRGSALILSVIILVNALFIVAAISSISISERKMSIRTKNTAAAFQAADSGIEYILGRIDDDDSPDSIDNFCGGTFSDTDGKCELDSDEVGGIEGIKVYFLDDEEKVITNESDLWSSVKTIRSVGAAGGGGFETNRALEVKVNGV